MPEERKTHEPRSRSVASASLLLLAAAIWGAAFVAQRVGMDYVGPFTYTAVRFAVGVIVLLPVILYTRHRGAFVGDGPGSAFRKYGIGGGVAGLALFGGISFQQMGLVYTTAGNAAFITGLYVVLVPILGLALGQRTTRSAWVGAALAAAGLYLLSVTSDFSMNRGDQLALVGAVIWAAHVQIIARVAPGSNPLALAAVQFTVCAALSWIVALGWERVAWGGIVAAAVPILYGGVMSVGVAYTLQVVVQRHVRPAHAAIVLSLEAVFAALSGWLILGESLTTRALVGCGLMLGGMLLSQLSGLWQRRRPTAERAE